MRALRIFLYCLPECARQVDGTVPEMTPLSKERGERGERERGRERSERGGLMKTDTFLSFDSLDVS